MLPITRLIIALLLFAGISLLVAIPVFVAATILGGFSLDTLSETSPQGMLIQGIITFPASVAALLLVGLLIERRRLEQFGFARGGAGRDLAVGFGVGALLMALVIGVLAAMGWYRVTGIATDADTLTRTLILFTAFFLGAFFEEALFRGIIFRIVEEGLGSWLALLLSSAVFGLVHFANPNGTLLAAVAIAVEAGILLGGAYMLTRSLWFAIGIHWAWNFVQGPIFGASVSGIRQQGILEATYSGPALWTGGTFGPEAGLIAALLCTSLGLLLLARAHRQGRFFTPVWMRRHNADSAAAPILPPAAES